MYIIIPNNFIINIDHLLLHKFLEGKTHNHLDLSYAERIFIYLPFEHSEDKGDQVSGNTEQQGFDYGLGGCRTLLSHFGH